MMDCCNVYQTITIIFICTIILIIIGLISFQYRRRQLNDEINQDNTRLLAKRANNINYPNQVQF